jgi:hypothetical protein
VSGRSAKAARRVLAARYAAVPPPAGHAAIDVAQLHDEALAAGWRPADIDLRPHDIRARLGRLEWGPPARHGEAGDTGWRFQRYDNTLLAIVSAACWPELPDVPIIHASISRHTPVQTPAYDDLQTLHRAVWPDGHAIQCFVPPGEHVNIRSNVLHLWGRADGQPLWPINFGRFGTI